MSDYDTIEPQAIEVGISPLYDGVTIVLEHGGQITLVILPAAAALGHAEMLRHAANKALTRGNKVMSGRLIEQKEVVARAKPEVLDS